MADWDSRTEVIRGNFGESIVDEFLKSNGIIVYPPVIGGAHPFDRLCATQDKSQIFIVEVKTKPRRKYREDTGINVKSYEEYLAISKRHSMDVHLFFVDEYTKSIYCGEISELSKPVFADGYLYPLREKTKFGREIIYFHLSSMETISELSEDQLAKLAGMTSTRKYAYPPAANDNEAAKIAA